jgi:hypothetical protein
VGLKCVHRDSWRFLASAFTYSDLEHIYDGVKGWFQLRKSPSVFTTALTLSRHVTMCFKDWPVTLVATWSCVHAQKISYCNVYKLREVEHVIRAELRWEPFLKCPMTSNNHAISIDHSMHYITSSPGTLSMELSRVSIALFKSVLSAGSLCCHIQG